MKYRLTPRAGRDLETIDNYIRSRNSAGARRVNEALQAGIQLVATHPFAGRVYNKRRRCFAVPRLPYLIFCRIDEPAGVVEILTIRHGARRPEQG